LGTRNKIHQTLKIQGGGKEMKKFVVLALFGLLIMAFSGMAYAQKLEFKASGSIDFDTVLNQNVPFYFGEVSALQGAHSGIFQTWITPSFRSDNGHATGSLDHTAGYVYSRGLLKFDAIMDKNLSGTIYFEIDALRWGGATAGTLTTARQANNMGAWAADQLAVEVKNVYIDVGLPYFGIPVPMTVRVGIQPFGVRPQMCVYTDGAGITGGIQAGPVMIIPMWAKMLENGDAAADDADMYGLHVNAKLGTFTVGGYGLYYNMNTYPLQYMTGVDWTKGGWPPGSFPAGAATGSSYGLTVPGTQRAAMWWFGLYADGKAGPVNLNVDFVYDWGKERQKLATSPESPLTPDVKYSGWAGRAKIDFPWEKFNFGMVGMYASGADANKTSTSGIAGSSVANRYLGSNPAYPTSRRVDSYVVPPGSEQSPGFNESIVMYSCFNAVADGGTGIANTGNYQQMSRGGIGGTAFIKGYGSMKLAPWYKITLQGLYIWDTTSHGNTFGTAVKNPSSPWISQILKDDNDIGFELDLIQEIDIYKNLKGFIGIGYLWAGKALDVYNNAFLGVSTYPGRNYSPNNPWNITTRLLYTF
jgi:hypothetical protein